MMRSLFAAVSGLRNHQLSLSVIGNNIANVNTVGFKTSRAVFQEMLSETLQGASRPTNSAAGTNPVQVGLGMSVASVNSSFNQGQLELTGNIMDMAVQGDGFFVLRNPSGEYYSRAGTFGFDGQGRVTAGQGLLVQGWMADDAGNIASSGSVDNIVLPFGQKSPARATAQVRLASNLDASAEALSTITQTNTLLALAQSQDQLQTLRDSQGRDLGVDDGDTIQVRYAATADALVTSLASATTEQPMDIQNGDTIVIGDGFGTATLTFDSSWTLSDLANQIQMVLNDTHPTLPGLGNETDIAVTVARDGTLQVANPAGGNNTDLTVTIAAAGRPVFDSVFSATPVINGTNSARSGEMIVDRKFTLGGSFTNMSSLAAAIEQVLQIGSSGASVSFANGQLSFSNIDDGVASNELVDLVLGTPGSPSVFETAMALTGNDLGLGETINSETLLDEATAQDNLTDLYNAQGVSLGLSTGSVFSFDALEGGVQLPQTTFTVSGTGDGSGSDRTVMTLGGLADELEDVLNLGSIGSATVVDGALRVEGRSGLLHELTGLSFSQANNAALAPGMAFAEVQAATDVTHETSIKVHDSLGETHLLTMVFTKDADAENRWTWQALVDDGQVLAGGTGAVTFNGDGSLESFTTDDGQPLQIDPANGADGPLAIEFDAGARGAVDGITGFARESTTAIVDQDGYTMGVLESISIGADGVITGDFTNGTSRALAQVALADFTNPAGLMRDAGNGWMTTPNSGSPVIRRPGAGTQVGSISAGTLEMSNVDIAQEFTNMIVAQRGFQANARTVTTSDEMLVELVNLKR
jgi:flagellar hook protein FlgE